MTRAMHWRPLLVAALAFAVVACDKSDDSKAAPSAEPTPSASPEPTASAPEPASAETEPTASAETEPSAAPVGSAAKSDGTKPAPAVKATAAAKTAAAEPAKSAEPERKVKTVGGTSASSDSFSLSISAPSPVRVGEKANAAIVLSARGPYHCNAKYPYKFAVEGGSTVRGMSCSEKTATMSVPFTPSQKGRTTVSGTLSFSVCTADKCLIEKRKLAVSVDAD